MDTEKVVSGRNALMAGVALFLLPQVAWKFWFFLWLGEDKNFTSYFYGIVASQVFGVLLILLGVFWVLSGIGQEETQEEPDGEKNEME